MTARPALNLIRPLVPAARASSSGLWWPHLTYLPSPHHRRIIHLFRQQTNFRNSGMFFSRTIRHFCSSSTFSSSSPSPSSSGAVVVAAAHILTVSPNPPVRLLLRSSSVAQTRIRFFSNNTNKNENEKKNSNNMSSTGIKQISTDKAMKRKSSFPFFLFFFFPLFSCRRGAEGRGHSSQWIHSMLYKKNLTLKKRKLTDTNKKI